MSKEKKVVNRKENAPNKTNGDKKGNGEEKVESKNKNSKYRFGPMPMFPNQRVWTRGILIIGILSIVWFSSKDPKEIKLAQQKEIHKNRGQILQCDRDYIDETRHFKGCFPKECGRYVLDTLITAKEADILLAVAQRGMALGGSTGGATILDLHSGALSYGTKFLNIYSLNKAKDVLSTTDLTIYKIVRSKIQRAIASNFEISEDTLHLTHPTFFSRLTNKSPQTDHDEYWHTHVDKVTYEAFHYTSLLYLSDFGNDFTGGRFVFLTDSNLNIRNVTVEPRKGRVLMFTSGAENPHLVEKVRAGERYAITISFTCNSSVAINDPSFH